MKHLRVKGAQIMIYEPTLLEDYFFENRVVHDLGEFKRIRDVVNRYDNCLEDILDKVYT